MQPYRTAIQVLRTKLEYLNDEMQCTLEYNLIHTIIHSRMKTSQSIIEKLRRKNLPITIEGLHQIYDIASLRVICHYINDIHILVGYDDSHVIEKRIIFNILKIMNIIFCI